MQSISAKEQRGRLRADQRIVGYGRFPPSNLYFLWTRLNGARNRLNTNRWRCPLDVLIRLGRLLYWGDVIQCRVRPTGGPSYLAILGPMERPNILADLKTGELWTLDQRISDGLLTSSTWVDEMGVGLFHPRS